jgi:hypothetical protein
VKFAFRSQLTSKRSMILLTFVKASIYLGIQNSNRSYAKEDVEKSQGVPPGLDHDIVMQRLLGETSSDAEDCLDHDDQKDLSDASVREHGGLVSRDLTARPSL